MGIANKMKSLLSTIKGLRSIPYISAENSSRLNCQSLIAFFAKCNIAAYIVMYRKCLTLKNKILFQFIVDSRLIN